MNQMEMVPVCFPLTDVTCDPDSSELGVPDPQTVFVGSLDVRHG